VFNYFIHSLYTEKNKVPSLMLSWKHSVVHKPNVASFLVHIRTASNQ